MPRFQVPVIVTCWLNVEVDADTEEGAEASCLERLHQIGCADYLEDLHHFEFEVNNAELLEEKE